MANRFVNHARNVWDRAVTLLPRVDQLWYKYVHMEEMLGMVANARVVFERWMRWEPDHNGWNAYVRFETRYKEWDLVRKVYERYCACHPSVKAFVRWAKFEFGLGEIANAREVYESAVEQMALETDVDQLYVAFAKFEELAGEHARARASTPSRSITCPRRRRGACSRPSPPSRSSTGTGKASRTWCWASAA